MKYLIVLILMVALGVSCSQKKTEPEKGQQQTQQQLEQAKFHLADLSVPICPGCGMAFKTDSEIADTLHYNGKVYGFCSSKCEMAFKENPQKVLAAVHERMEKMSPMHQEGQEEHKEHQK